MSRRTVGTAMALAVLVGSFAAAQDGGDLARRLPLDKTAVFVQLDVKRTLDEVYDSVMFIDAETGAKIVRETTNLWEAVKELAATYEFQPALLDRVGEIQVYFVLMSKDEPEVKVSTYQTPKFDPETWEEIEGEFEEHTNTETKYFTPSIIVKAPDEATAENLMEEVKALIDREREKDAEATGPGRRDVEVDVGEMIMDEDGDTIGRVGEYVIVSEGMPMELWAGLTDAPSEGLSTCDMYNALTEGESTPQVLALVNSGGLLSLLGDSLKRAMEEAEKESGGQDDGETAETNWELEQAKTSYKVFQMFDEILSLDKWDYAGTGMRFDWSDDRGSSDFQMLFSHGQPISTVLTELLDGSGSFRLPQSGLPEGICMMTRIDVKRIYDEVIAILRGTDPEMMSQYDMQMQMMKQAFGANAEEIVGMFAGDSYLFMDFVEKEMDMPVAGAVDETGQPQWRTEKRMVMLPSVTLLWGLAEPQAARNTLSALVAGLTVNPMFNQFVAKRTYQETDVFCFGMNAANVDTYPDGTTAFAAVIVDRYLSIGNWEYVTALVRRMQSGGREMNQELQDVVEQHTESNLLVVMTKEAQEKIQQLNRKQQKNNEEMFAKLIEQLEQQDFEIEDKELERRIKDSAMALIRAFEDLQTKAAAMAPQLTVMTGTHRGNVYELRGASEITR